MSHWCSSAFRSLESARTTYEQNVNDLLKTVPQTQLEERPNEGKIMINTRVLFRSQTGSQGRRREGRVAGAVRNPSPAHSRHCYNYYFFSNNERFLLKVWKQSFLRLKIGLIKKWRWQFLLLAQNLERNANSWEKTQRKGNKRSNMRGLHGWCKMQENIYDEKRPCSLACMQFLFTGYFTYRWTRRSSSTCGTLR